MTSQQSPRPTQPVEYKGEPLDPARGPGLGCFWFQMALLVALLVITPLSATSWGWPTWVTTVLFVVMIILLLISGQTMIFLLRLVAAGRGEGRRRPLASTTPTVGEIEDELPAETPPTAARREDELPPETKPTPARREDELPPETKPTPARREDELPAEAPNPNAALGEEPLTQGATDVLNAQTPDQPGSADPPATPGSDVPGVRQ